MCYGFAMRCAPMGHLYGLPIVVIAAAPQSHFRHVFWLRSCALNSKPRAHWRGLRRRRLRPCVSVPSDASIGVSVLDYGGSAGGGAKVCYGLQSRVQWPPSTHSQGGRAMIPYLFYYHLVTLVLLWLCLMVPHLWPSPTGGAPKTPPRPIRPQRKRSTESKLCVGLTQKPHCALC